MIEDRISHELKEIEETEGVEIIYACESGSRAWGFPSKDSDYDVRFIYVRPKEWYLSILELGQKNDNGKKIRDVIERPISDELDISGWDLKKALFLFRKSNPPLVEWLNSPIVYWESIFSMMLRDLIPKYYSKTSASYHYLNMAKRNLKEYLSGETIWTKKYFYVLRPVLAVLWMEQGLGVVPTDFNVILNGIDIHQKIKDEVNKLILLKKNGEELRVGKRNNIISSFLEEEFDRLESSRFIYPKVNPSHGVLDEFFVHVLDRCE